MVGHRTRLAQESPESWHVGEDQELAAYLAASHRLDRRQRGSRRSSLVAGSSWGCWGWGRRWSRAVSRPSRWRSAWGGRCWPMKPGKSSPRLWGIWRVPCSRGSQVAPLFAAAARPQVVTPPAYALPPGAPLDEARGAPLLEAHALVFRHRARGAPVLQACSLEMRRGERLLLEGPSGGGKSTLASLLTGLRQPESGLLLLGGLDLPTLGAAGWRRRVVAAPQFHDNHVFSRDAGLQPAHGPPLAPPAGRPAGGGGPVPCPGSRATPRPHARRAVADRR